MASNRVHWSKYTMLCANPIQFNPMQCNVRTSSSFLLFSHCRSLPTRLHTLCCTITTTTTTTGMCSTALLSNNRQVFLPELSLRSIITYNKLLRFGTPALSLFLHLRSHLSLTSAPFFYKFFAILEEKKELWWTVWALLPLLNNRLTRYFSLRFQCARRI